jgi:hypothetical protein
VRRAPAAAARAALAVALLCGTARAQPAPEPWLGFRGRLEWITAATATAPRDTEVNPRNAVLRIPQASAQSELRPDLRVERGAELQVVARPRLLLEAAKTKVGGAWQPVTRDAKVSWLDLYGAWRVNDRLTVAYGRQSFQWGPAELLSPSNRIFHETGFARDPLYVVHGKTLVRVNLSAGQSFSAIVLVETEDDGEEPFRAGAEFEQKAAVKLEWTAESGRGYLGVTGGGGEVGRGYFGEYAAVQLTDGWSLYADAVHTAGSEAWVPVERPGAGVAFEQPGRLRGLRALAVGGTRYTFADGTDFRIEYVFDEAGWDRTRFRLANRAAAAFPPTADQAARVGAWQRPGFELLGRQLGYVSMTFTELPPRKRTKVQLRGMQSLDDGSSAVFLTVSHDATDSTVVFVSATGTEGRTDTALARAVHGSAVAGVVVNW